MLNSLVYVYGFTSDGKGESIYNLDCKNKLVIEEFASQVTMYSVSVFFAESISSFQCFVVILAECYAFR